MESVKKCADQRKTFLALLFLFWGLCGAKRAAAQTWVQLAPTGPTPSAPSNMNAVYDAAGNAMIVFGGESMPRNSATTVLSNANGLGGMSAWAALSPMGQLPPGRDVHSVVYDSAHDRMIIFGGFSAGGPLLNDTWVLSNASGSAGSPSWAQLSPTGELPPPLAAHTAVYDPASNRMIVFGGCTGSTSLCNVGLNDTWVLTNANGLGGTPQWIKLQPSGPLPPGRNSHTAAYDPASNRMIIFGGATNGGGGTILNDTWVLANANGLGGTPQWIQLIPSTTIPGRFNHTAIYDPTTNRMTVFSGAVDTAHHETNQVWVLTNANGLGGTPVWTQLSPAGGPPLPREDADAVYDPASNRMTIFSGYSDCSVACNLLVDVWVLTNANGTTGSGLGITQVLPGNGGNGGSVTMQLFGNGFVQGDQVALLQQGGTSLTTTNVNFVSANLLTATFDLTQATAGTYDVVVTPPTGPLTMLAGGFTVEQGGAPNVYVDIIGRNEVRFGQPTTFYVVVGNSGTVDSSPGLLSLSVPLSLSFIQQSGSDLYVAGSTTNAEFSTPGASSGNENLLFATQGVPAGQTQTASVQLTLPLSPTSPDPTVTLQWVQELLNLGLDNYLGLQNIPFIPYPASGCPNCLNDYNAELLAQSKLANAYLTLLDLQPSADNAIATFVADSSITVGAAFVVATSGAGVLGSVSIGFLAAATTACVDKLINDDSCLPSLKNTISTAIGAIKSCSGSVTASASCLQNLGLPPTAVLTSPVAKALGELQTFGGLTIDAINTLTSGVDVISEENAAYLTFQQALGPYEVSRANYQACLSQCGNPPPPLPPPPIPPGTSSLTFTGVTSLDPNDKVGSQGAGIGQFISVSTPLRYSVDFGNKDTATAPAQQVVITDQLDITNDNLATLSLGPISFGSQLITPPSFQTSFSTTVDLRPTTDLLVAVNANLNPATGMLTWNFQSLDPSTDQPPTDPTIGFLPPGGNGSVFYTIMPKPGLETGTQINNQATVVFDQNSPITTPTWLNTLDNTPPSSMVAALPSTESCSSFQVVWSGTDVGSGVKDFTIFVSDDGAAFAPWLTDTPATSATYSGQPGHTYSFYSIAEDQVGNVEAAKTSAEATTQTNATPACGRPSLAGRILSSSLSGTTLTVNLQLTDTGAGDARNIQIGDFRLRVLTGTGTVSYLGALPVSVGDVLIGNATTLTLTFSVPSSITKFVLTEDGTLQDVPGNTYNFSIGQVVFP